MTHLLKQVLQLRLKHLRLPKGWPPTILRPIMLLVEELVLCNIYSFVEKSQMSE